MIIPETGCFSWWCVIQAGNPGEVPKDLALMIAVENVFGVCTVINPLDESDKIAITICI